MMSNTPSIACPVWFIVVFATATSEAKFKVGLIEETNVNDLVIKTDINDTSTFENELVKYLRILNKL